MKNFSRSYILCVITGVLFGLSFPPIDFNFLVFFAFASCCLIISECISYKDVFRRFYVVFISFGLVSVSWLPLSGMQENADRFLIFGGIFTLLVHPLFFVFPALLSFAVIKAGRKLSLPFWLQILPFLIIYTGCEYLQTLGEINFPWLTLGYSHTYLISKVQYIDITGIYGASFWICVTGYLIFLAYTHYRGKNKQKAIVFIASALLLYFVPDIYNTVTNVYDRCNSNGQKIKTAILQPNINPWKKWSQSTDSLISIYKSQIREAALQKPDLIVLPETAIPFDILDSVQTLRYTNFKSVIDSVNIPVLTGFVHRSYFTDSTQAPSNSKSFRSGRRYITYNSSVLIEPNSPKENLSVHNKARLVVGAERIPYAEKLTFLKDFAAWSVGVSGFSLGEDTTLFKLPNEVSFNSAICYESVFPEFVAEYSDKGADFLTIITNDGWYGKLFGPYQHNQYAVMRAIENRRWIVRCANTGISCTISPCGEIINPTQLEERTILYGEVEVRKDVTFYSHHKDIFAKILLGITFLLFTSSIIFLRVTK